MGLCTARIKAAQGSEVVILFGGDGPRLRQIPGDARCRREIEPRNTFVRVVEDRIENKIQLTEMPAEDRADLGCITVGIPMARVVAELEIDSIEEGPLRRIRRNKQRPQFESVQDWSEIAGDGIERQIKPGF